MRIYIKIFYTNFISELLDLGFQKLVNFLLTNQIERNQFIIYWL